MRTKDKTPARPKSAGRIMKMPAGKTLAVKRGPAVKRPIRNRPASRPDLAAGRTAASRNSAMFRVNAIFFGFVMIYVLRNLFVFALEPHTAIDRITPGSVSAPVDLEGVIIRDEKVYKSPAAGTVKFNADENERVRKGDAVCSVQNSEAVSLINAELAGVNEEILKRQDMREGLTDLSGNGRRINESLKEQLDDWAGGTAANDFASVYQLKDKLTDNIERRNQLILDDISDSLSEQAGKRMMYQEELSRNMTLVAAEESGVVSSLLDGFEETYTQNITAMLSKEQTTPKGAFKPLTVKTAEPGTPLFKIIHSNSWYIAAYIPNEIIAGWQENDIKTLGFDADFRVPATVARITPAGAESYVLFKCTRFIERFLNTRSVRFKISGDASEGLKIPETAVAVKTLISIPRPYVTVNDDQMKMAKLTKAGGEEVSFFYTAIDDAAVYADAAGAVITLGMEIQSPAGADTVTQLTETADITGVYRVNNGVADFRKVVLSDNGQNSGYYILDPDLNKNLQEKDSIVHNAGPIKEGQIIF